MPVPFKKNCNNVMDSGRNKLSYKNKLLMDANKILSADVLDILFEGRNKAYGAYDLRKTYRQRLGKALMLMLSFLLLVFGVTFLFGFIKPSAGKMIVDRDIILAEAPPPAEKRIVPPPVTQPPKAAVVNTRQFTTHMIIEKDPPEDEKPPK